jgi:peptidoglycan-N-acetylglucosamine deacetylase
LSPCPILWGLRPYSGSVRPVRTAFRRFVICSVAAVAFTVAACGGTTPSDQPAQLAPSSPSPVRSSESPSLTPAAAPAPTTPASSEAATGEPGATPPPVAASLFPSRPDGLPVVVESGPRDGRRVALTFDADMTPHMLRRLESGETASYYNEALIAELRRLRVPATLFLTGLWMQRYPQATQELAADSLFELGTHTWQHRAFTANCYGLAQVPPAEMLDEVTRAQRLLDELAGSRATKLFRFPGGCYDGAALQAIAPSGVTVIQFDVPAGDGFQNQPEPIVRTVLDGVRGGSIVVLHMNGGNTSPRTADAVGPIVAGLRDQGYTLTTVSGLFAP